MKNITLLTGFVLLVSAVSLRAQLMSPSVSGGINGNQARVPGQSFIVNVTIGGTRSDATHDHTYNVEVYFSSRPNDITPPAVRLSDILVVLPGNKTMSSVVNQTFAVPTTFNGNATAAGSYYIILRLPGTQSTAIQSFNMSVVVADISVEAPSGTILTDGTANVSYGSVGTIYTNPIDFIIRNTGSADLMPLAANVTGANAGDFTFDSPLATSLSPSQGSTLLRVRFNPSSEGSKTAALHITSNVAGAKSSFDINLSGTGVVLPAVSTLAATDITTTGAVVHGTVNPNGGTVSLDFLYGLSGVAGTTKSQRRLPLPRGAIRSISPSRSRIFNRAKRTCSLPRHLNLRCPPRATVSFSRHSAATAKPGGKSIILAARRQPDLEPTSRLPWATVYRTSSSSPRAKIRSKQEMR